MKIGIDISQTGYEKTGVGTYLSNFVTALLNNDKKNEYILFFSSLRKSPSLRILEAARNNPNAKLKIFKIPPTVLNLLWNSLHIMPVENLIGKVDLFITSDWTEPPSKNAKKGTIIYDLVVYKYPNETDAKIVRTHKRKLEWVKKESDLIFAISNSTKKDIEEILRIDKNKIKVIYPGA